jgi:hypothetical protein
VVDTDRFYDVDYGTRSGRLPAYLARPVGAISGRPRTPACLVG